MNEFNEGNQVNNSGRKAATGLGIGCLVVILIVVILVVLAFNFLFKPFNSMKNERKGLLYNMALTFERMFNNINKTIEKEQSMFENNNNNNNQDIYNHVIDGFDKSQKEMFNHTFEYYNGSNDKSSLINLLEKVILNNNKNIDRKITIKFKNLNTSDQKELINLKHNLDDNKEYEVIFDYDDGIINNINIEEFEKKNINSNNFLSKEEMNNFQNEIFDKVQSELGM